MKTVSLNWIFFVLFSLIFTQALLSPLCVYKPCWLALLTDIPFNLWWIFSASCLFFHLSPPTHKFCLLKVAIVHLTIARNSFHTVDHPFHPLCKHRIRTQPIQLIVHFLCGLLTQTLRLTFTHGSVYQIAPQHHSRILNDLSFVSEQANPIFPKTGSLYISSSIGFYWGIKPTSYFWMCSSTRHMSHLSVHSKNLGIKHSL